MENSYGIGVANRYALFLDDESDPLETLSLKEQEKELKKKNKVAEKENKVKTPTVPKGKPTPAQKKPVKDTNNKPQELKRDETKQTPRNIADGKPERERNFNKFNNENREERNNRRNREDRPYNGPSENRDRDDRPRREPVTGDNFENRNRDRGDRREGREGREGGREGREGREGRALGNKPGGPRGPRRTFDGDRRGKREFDRQSGSDKTHGYRGVKPIDKRDGGGAHNWGSHKDVIEEADRPNTDANESWGDEVKVDQPEIEKKEEVETEPTPVEEEPKELTLDEWKAQRAGRVKPTFNIRKAGEGEDPSQWKKMFELRKKEKDEESEEEEYDASEYPQRVGRQKHILDIDIQFYDSTRRGGGRGRGQRSGGPRGGNRGGGGGGGANREERRGGGGGGSSGGGPNPEGGERERRPREGGERAERRYHNDAQSAVKAFVGDADRSGETRQAPKVDDERDFPSLG